MDSLTNAPNLPPIVENQILHIDVEHQEDEEDDDVISYNSDDERMSLVHSEHLSLSCTQSTCKYQSTQEQETQSQVQSTTNPDSPRAMHQVSIMTELQASMFLPSLMISSFSSAKRSHDHMARSVAQSITKRSMYSSKSLAHSIIEKFSDDRGASFALTMFNIMPALLGSALFSIPYAVSTGGYLTVPFFCLIALLSDLTCLLLADSMYEVSPKSKRVKRTKLDCVEIAHAAFGKHGSRLMNFTLIFYLFAVSVVNIVLIGKTSYTILNSYTHLSLQLSMAIFSAAVVPTLFIQRLSHLAYLSFISSIAIVIGGIASVVVFITQNSSWTPNGRDVPIFQWDGFALALGIWSYSVVPQYIIPQVEACMVQPRRFPTAVHLSFGISTPVKIIFGILGAVTYGKTTDAIVAKNILAYSYPVSVLVNSVVLCFAIMNFPLNFFVVCDAFDVITLKKKHVSLKKGGKYHPFWIAMTRPILVGMALGVGLVVPYFELLVGVLGSLLGTLLAFIFPCLFHLKLKWKVSSIGSKLTDLLILLIGSSAGIIGLYASLKGLVEAII